MNNMNKFKLSIITPVFNGKRFIEGCIKNVIDQNCPLAEHIIVDGGSTDGTLEVIEKYAKEYGHILWLSEKDGGQAEALNKGIAMARGKIIGTLNVDDFYEKNIFDRVIKYFEKLPENSFLTGNCKVWGDGEVLKFICKPSGCGFLNLLVGEVNPLFYRKVFPVNPSEYFYHASLHQSAGFYEDLYFSLDLDFVVRVAKEATIIYVDEMWGNQRLIEGTKTLFAIQNGLVSRNSEMALDRYRKSTSFYNKVNVGVRRRYFWMRKETIKAISRVRRKIYGFFGEK